MKKNCLLTILYGDYYQKLSSLTYPTIESYAKKIDCDFVIGTHMLDVYELLNQYERIIYVDTDLIIRDDCPNLFNITPKDKLGMFNEGKYIDKKSKIQEVAKFYCEDIQKWDGKYYNSGIMVISRIHKQLFRKIANMSGDKMEEYFNLRICIDKIEMFDLSYNFNRLPFLDKEIGIHRLNSYIVHYSGAPPEQIFSIVYNDIEEWKEVSPNYNKYSKRCIVVSVTAGMGDQLCSEPVVRYMRKEYFPDCDIKVVTHHPRLFEHIKGIELFDYNKYKGTNTATLVLYTTPEDKFNFHTLSHVMFHPTDFAAISTIKKTLPNLDKPIKLVVYDDDIKEVQNIIGKDVNLKDLIVIHPGKWWDSKTFPVSWWQEIIDELSKNNKIVIIGKRLSDKQGYQDVVCPEGCYDLRDLTTLGGMIGLISEAKLTLTNDSSPVHIAGAFDNWLVVIPTAKHPDHILPFRTDKNGVTSQYYKTIALYKKLTLDDLDTFWLSENPDNIDIVKGDILDYIPEPEDVVNTINKIMNREDI